MTNISITELFSNKGSSNDMRIGIKSRNGRKKYFHSRLNLNIFFPMLIGSE